MLAEATVALDPAVAVSQVRSAVAIASDRRLVAVLADAPGSLWERPEIRRLDLPLWHQARHRLISAAGPRDGAHFTVREIEVLRLMARAVAAQAIAEQMYVSVNTVKWHKANIYRKLKVTGGGPAIERARELGLIPEH